VGADHPLPACASPPVKENPIGLPSASTRAWILVLSPMAADTLIADKAFDTDGRVLEPLAAAGNPAAGQPVLATMTGNSRRRAI